MKKSFTDKYLSSLKPTKKQYYVRESHGFALRVLPSGVKTFIYIYQSAGKRRQLNLGIYPAIKLADARKKYLDAASLLAKGIDPQAPPPKTIAPEEITISTLLSDYIGHIKTHLVADSVTNQSARLSKHLIPTWGTRPINELRRRNAIALIELIAKETPGAARNVLLAARAMFTYAMQRELIEFNPFSNVGVAVPQAAPRSRARVISDEELRSVLFPFLLAPSGNEIVKRVLLLILMTGQRPGEVTGMQKSEISHDWWTIPWQRIKTEKRPKLQRPPVDQRVYLAPQVHNILPPTFESSLFFPKCRGAIGSIDVNSLSKHIKNSKPTFLGLERWTPHDLRRTSATKLLELGAPNEIIAAILNHKTSGVIGVYNRNKYDMEKQKWLGILADYWQALSQQSIIV